MCEHGPMPVLMDEGHVQHAVTVQCFHHQPGKQANNTVNHYKLHHMDYKRQQMDYKIHQMDDELSRAAHNPTHCLYTHAKKACEPIPRKAPWHKK